MKRLKQFLAKRKQQRIMTQEKESKKAVLDELFNDLYNNRRRVYKMNFIRGVLFGLGSAIGGTVAIAVVVWLLSLFVNVPLLGELFQDAQSSIKQSTSESR